MNHSQFSSHNALKSEFQEEVSVNGKMKKVNKPKGSIKAICDDKAEEWFQNKKSSSYYWTNTQNTRYLKFLQDSGYLLQLSPQERKRIKVNNIMSKKIKTRSPTQCHTHHQKMMKKYYNIEGILGFYNKQRNDKPKIGGCIKPNSSAQVKIEEEKFEMKSASQILAIGSIVVLKDYTHMEEQIYEYSQFNHGYTDPFAHIDLL